MHCLIIGSRHSCSLSHGDLKTLRNASRVLRFREVSGVGRLFCPTWSLDRLSTILFPSSSRTGFSWAAMRYSWYRSLSSCCWGSRLFLKIRAVPYARGHPDIFCPTWSLDRLQYCFLIWLLVSSRLISPAFWLLVPSRFIFPAFWRSALSLFFSEWFVFVIIFVFLFSGCCCCCCCCWFSLISCFYLF